MKRAMIAATAVVLLVLVATVPFRPALAQAPVIPQPPVQPGPPVPPAQPAADPRAAQIKAVMERNGLQVRDVHMMKRPDQRDFTWFVYTPADYARPTVDAVRNHAVKVWYWMSTVLSQEPPGTTMVNGQAWIQYRIMLFVEVGHFNAFLASYQAAKDDNERAAAFRALDDKLGLRIYDTDRSQFVDVRDFINKNFAR